MSIDFSGINSKISMQGLTITIKDTHPLVKLANMIPWEELFNLVLPDLQKTAKGKWWCGRKLKLRIHLAAYLLQQLYNKTDRQIEYEIKDNAAFQLFCGNSIVANWHCPDHTKVEEFRSRLAANTQREAANLIACYAVKVGFADPRHCDIDSTIQSANISRPSKAAILTKIACAAKKVAVYLENKVLSKLECITSGLTFFNIKKIKVIFKEYVFTKKKLSPSEIKEKMKILFQAVITPVADVLKVSNGLFHFQKDKLPWNMIATIVQLANVGWEYIKKIGDELYFNKKALDLPLALHVKEVACFSKNKQHTKKHQFGRAYQLTRLKGNFILVGECANIRMNDKESLAPLLLEHKQYFRDYSAGYPSNSVDQSF